MKAYMTVEEARKIERSEVKVGSTYTFYSDCVGCKVDDESELIRSYSGQPVTVVDKLWDTDDDTLASFQVRAANGVTFQANEGELNGWIFDTGQWVGPRVN